MKNLKKYKLLLYIIPFLFSACKKDNIEVYQDDPGIYFSLPSYSYSFTENAGAQTKTIYLPVKLSGSTKDYDRVFDVEVVNDKNTTAASSLFQINKGVVLKNSFDGSVAIILKRNTIVDTSVVYLNVKLIGSNELDPLMTKTLQVSWTGKIIQPVNWTWLRYYFGTPFSTGWYTYMLKEAGVPLLPYHGTLSKTDPVTWWMSAAQVVAYALKVKEALIKYNAAHPGDELKHNDGPYAGQLVTMPAF